MNVPKRSDDAPARDQSEYFDRLLRVSAPHERIVLAGVSLALLAFVVWLFFGGMARTVTVDGILIAPGERHMAASVETGQLLEYLVSPGDHVKAGQEVARQSVPELNREASVLNQRLDLLQTQLGRAGGDALRELLDLTQTASIEIEARRTARQMIVSPDAGEVTAMLSVPGSFLEAGTEVVVIRGDADGPPGAVLRVDQDLAQRLRPGMPASIEMRTPDGGTQRLDGEVAGIAAGRLPVWLNHLMPAAPNSWHRVEIMLSQVPAFPVPDGMACRITIELDRGSPASLLLSGGS